jgi:hypothetical protein
MLNTISPISIILSIHLLLSNLSFSQQSSWPSYSAVVDSFFSSYDFPFDERYIRFEKRKDGWYVAELLHTDADNGLPPTKYWSAESGSFLKLPYKNSPKDSADLAYWRGFFNRNFMDQFSLYQFERNRYFGYNGWNWDVIMDAGNIHNLGDTALESLARAYASYATGFFSNQFGFHFVNNDSDRAIIKQATPITNSRREKFDKFHRKALECYELLGKKYPNYSTSIGDIKTKIANETFTGFFQLSLAGDSIRAKYYLNKCQFPDSVLIKARNLLEDAPPNCLLFITGDSHTYGIWYLQAKEKVRTDVKAINYDLLALQRYVKYIDDRNGDGFFTTPQSFFMNDTALVLVRDETDSDREIESGAFLTQVKFPDQETLTAKPGTLPYAYYPGAKIVFPCKNIEGENSIENFSLTLKNYMYLNDFLLFDLIHTHCKSKKIGFTFVNEDLLELLSEYKSIFLLGGY